MCFVSTTSISFLALSVQCVAGELKSFHDLLGATASTVHYTTGYLTEPGYVDLSNIRFIVNDGSSAPEYQDDNWIQVETTDSEGTRRELDGVSQNVSTVDVVLFQEPSECARSKRGCYWPELGIGSSDASGNRYCCSDMAEEGYCNNGTVPVGRLLVNSAIFNGDHRNITVPESGNFILHVDTPRLDIQEGTGKYVLVISNCNNMGRDVQVVGSYAWMSKDGYLPGNLFNEWKFYIGCTTMYLIICLWYGFSMRANRDSFIRIQMYIIIAICLSLLEMCFKSVDYWIWNEQGIRSWYAIAPWIAIRVLKRALSRCLMVMVCLGWGVIRDTLKQMNRIVLLGSIYVGLSVVHTITEFVMLEELQTLNIDKETSLISFFNIVTFFEATVDVIFYMWILDALIGTMQYLENMKQIRKLRQYLRLRLILLLSMFFATVWVVFGAVNASLGVSMLDDYAEWGILAAWDVNYLFLLLSIAILWKPTPNSKEYAFVMELPSEVNEMDEMELYPNTFTDNVDVHDLDLSIEDIELT